MSPSPSSVLARDRADRRLYAEPMRGFGPGGRPMKAGTFNENETRTAAGLGMLLGVVAFVFAAVENAYAPIQVLTTFLFVDFSLRVMFGLHHSPLGVLGRLLTRSQSPKWVSSRPRRFAWAIGMALSLALMVLTNGGIRGALPLALGSIFLVMTWSESMHGVCLGSRLHGWLVRRDLAARDAAFDVCVQRIDTRLSDSQPMRIFPSRKDD